MIAFGWFGRPTGNVGVLVLVLLVMVVSSSLGLSLLTVAAFADNIKYPSFSFFFSTNHLSGEKCSPITFLHTSKLFYTEDMANSDDNDDERGLPKPQSNSGNSSSSSSFRSGGQDLAKGFYRQMQGQNDDNITDDSSKTKPRPSLFEEQVRYQNSQPFSQRRLISTSSSSSSTNSMKGRFSKRKYTGQSDSLLNEIVPLGTREQRTNINSVQRQSMMEREYQLAGRGAGVGLALQAIVAVFALIFYIYVGWSGGIVSGDVDRTNFGGSSDDGDTMYYYEQVVTPVPRDSETSVWL
jgi:hypothetical protein